MKLEWDHYSDQPAVIKDKEVKRRIYKQIRWDSVKMLFTNIIMYPICFLFYCLFPVKKIEQNSQHFFGLSINLDKHPTDTEAMVKDLGANNLLIRMPLADIENIQHYVNFANKFSDKNLLINILQDRKHVEDSQLLYQSLEKIFSQFSPITTNFQLGNAINRKKWAIFSMDEFFQFYKVGYDLRNKKFPDIRLLGSSVIDFEYYFSIRTLYNLSRIRFDQFSCLLYVDRRGAPENTQMGLDLIKKLHLLQSMLRLSRKSSNEIVITETNWPISNTAPYAPTGEGDCVSLEDQASFLVRYYILALASNVVKNVYWHQLIAPGYGLVDDRNNDLIKYPSYFAFKTMLEYLQGAEFKDLIITDNNFYTAIFLNHTEKKQAQEIKVCWSNSQELKTIDVNDTKQQIVSIDGTEITDTDIKFSSSPIYLISELNQ